MPSTSISENWLRDLVTFDCSAEELAEKLIALGIEVDDVRNTRRSLAPFRVALVESVAPHPDADRLSVCTVDDGSGESLTVVCGAPNVMAGQHVAFAPVGTVMPGAGFTIGRRKLRGVASEGMICSESEIGLGDGADGIMVLDPDTEIGTSLGDLFGDAVLAVDLTPNRGDCASHLGIAREVRAISGVALTFPDHSPAEVEGTAAAEVVSIDIKERDACSHYLARVVRNVTIAESPDWLKRRLLAIGVRPINNVVDAASYVMFELGHPLHAFDYRKVAGRAITVRRSEPGEKFTTLDNKERDLPEGTILITDAEKPVAIAGIMGGANSEIDGTTTDVLIESAWFDPVSIRSSARTLGLSTDASYRFERGADPAVLRVAADRAADLIQQVAGGDVLTGVSEDGGPPDQPRLVDLRHQACDRILGVIVPPERQIEILDLLGFEVMETVEGGVTLAVPSWRSDVASEIDLIEEVGRVWGFDRIPEVTSTGALSFAPPEPGVALSEALRSTLIASGFSETVMQYQTDPESAARYTSSGAVELVNGLGRDTSFMRSSLMPSLAALVGRNQRHGRSDLRMFEIGKAFRRSERKGSAVPGIVEMEEVAFVMAGAASAGHWSEKSRDVDIYDAKGVVTHLFATLGYGLPEYHIEEEELWGFSSPALSVHLAGEEVGRIGHFDEKLVTEHEVAGRPVAFVGDIGRIVALSVGAGQYNEPARYPTVTRDLSLLVDRSTRHESLVATITATASNLLREVSLFDIYEGEKGEGENNRTSMSYRLVFGSDERTLVEEEIEKEIAAIVATLGGELGAELRG